MCPSRWLTATMGMSHASERAFAKCTPTQRHGSSPGPYVTAIALMSGLPCRSRNGSSCSNNSGSRLSMCARTVLEFSESARTVLAEPVCGSLMACSSIGTRFFACSRLATLGKTPPYCAWSAACEVSPLPRMRNVKSGPKVPCASMRHTAVSSHEVSMPRTRIDRVKNSPKDFLALELTNARISRKTVCHGRTGVPHLLPPCPQTSALARAHRFGSRRHTGHRPCGTLVFKTVLQYPRGEYAQCCGSRGASRNRRRRRTHLFGELGDTAHSGLQQHLP